jgi:hypothetical protein
MGNDIIDEQGEVLDQKIEVNKNVIDHLDSNKNIKYNTNQRNFVISINNGSDEICFTLQVL